MTEEICGAVNEVRRQFVSEQGETGSVHFGRTYLGTNNLRQLTHVSVSMLDGREAYGQYNNPKAVILKVRVGSRRRRVKL